VFFFYFPFKFSYLVCYGFVFLVIWCVIFNFCWNLFVTKLARTRGASIYWAESSAQRESRMRLTTSVCIRGLHGEAEEATTLVGLDVHE